MSHRSRILFLGVLVICGAIALSACGVAGNPGASGLGVWVEYSESDEIYAISAPALPSAFSYGRMWYGSPTTSTTYYVQDVGTTSYWYQLRWYSATSGYHYSTTWYGTMTIEREPGMPGGLLANGADGADRYYDWVLGWSGSTLTWGNSPRALDARSAAPASRSVAPAGQIPTALPIGDPALFDIGPATVTTISDGLYRITLREYGCTPRGSPASGSKTAAS
jgi:hypothetical protein